MITLPLKPGSLYLPCFLRNGSFSSRFRQFYYPAFLLRQAIDLRSHGAGQERNYPGMLSFPD